jgi:hypothetical protein
VRLETQPQLTFMLCRRRGYRSKPVYKETIARPRISVEWHHADRTRMLYTSAFLWVSESLLRAMRFVV